MHGSDFISLVCESFGVWSPFALFAIADCTTVTNDLSRKIARKRLLQHLWKYNASMILRRYALCPEDGIGFG